MKNQMILPLTINKIINKADELRRVNLAIEETERLLNQALAALEEMREWQRRLVEEIERLTLADAVEYPAVIYDEYRPFKK